MLNIYVIGFIVALICQPALAQPVKRPDYQHELTLEKRDIKLAAVKAGKDGTFVVAAELCDKAKAELLTLTQAYQGDTMRITVAGEELVRARIYQPVDSGQIASRVIHNMWDAYTVRDQLLPQEKACPDDTQDNE